MSKPYRNPYQLELALARVIGWAWFIFMIWYIGAWVIDELPSAWEDHALALFVLLLFASGFIGAAESRASREYAKHEEKMIALLRAQVHLEKERAE